MVSFPLSLHAQPNLSPPPSTSFSLDSRELKELTLIQNDLESIKVYSLTRIAISNPDIADIANVTDQEVLLIGKVPGQTTVFIWDEYGKRSFNVHVIEQNLNAIKGRIEKLLSLAGIKEVQLEVNQEEGKIVVRGTISVEKYAKVEPILSPFASNLFNMLEVEENQDLIEIEAQISELNTSLTSTLGFDWTNAFTYKETLPIFDGSVGDLFKIGDFNRTNAITSVVNLIIQEGKGRVLSRPKLVVKNGEEASFLVGGQLPISTQTITTEITRTITTQEVTYQTYGVSLTITPTIRKGKIDLTLSVDVTDIDASNSSGGNVAFTTRSANTVLYLENGQTIVMAGLIKQNQGQTVRKLPFLGEIPVVGLLFRNKSVTPNTSTEMVVSLTTTILAQKKEVTEEQKEEEAVEQPVTQSSEKFSQEKKEELVKETTESPQSLEKEETTSVEKSRAIPEIKKDESQTMIAEVSQKKASEKAPVEETKQLVGEEQKTVFPETRPKSVQQEKIATQPGSKAKEIEISPEGKTRESSETMVAYVKSIQKRIFQASTFPYEAKEQGWEGTVRLKLHILNDGTLERVSLKESSGHNVFDKDALNTAQIVAPYPPFPPELELKELIITIPIVYSQKCQPGDDLCQNQDKIRAELSKKL